MIKAGYKTRLTLTCHPSFIFRILKIQYSQVFSLAFSFLNNMNFSITLLDVSKDNGMEVTVIKVIVILIFSKHV